MTSPTSSIHFNSTPSLISSEVPPHYFIENTKIVKKKGEKKEKNKKAKQSGFAQRNMILVMGFCMECSAALKAKD